MSLRQDETRLKDLDDERNAEMKINQCPKCGREPRRYRYIFGHKYQIECLECGLDTGLCESADEAVTKWNEMTKGETNETTKTK